jgi:hypothetical protein
MYLYTHAHTHTHVACLYAHVACLSRCLASVVCTRILAEMAKDYASHVSFTNKKIVLVAVQAKPTGYRHVSIHTCTHTHLSHVYTHMSRVCRVV